MSKTPVVKIKADGSVVVLKPNGKKLIGPLPAPQQDSRWDQHGADILEIVCALWGVTDVDDLFMLVNNWGDEDALIVSKGGHSTSALVTQSVVGKILYCPEDAIWKGIQANQGIGVNGCLVIGCSYGIDVETDQLVTISHSKFINCQTPDNTGAGPHGGYGRWVGPSNANVLEEKVTYHLRDDDSKHASVQYSYRQVGHVVSKQCSFHGSSRKDFISRATDGTHDTMDCVWEVKGNVGFVSIGGGAAGPGFGSCPGTHIRPNLMGKANFIIQPGCSGVKFQDPDITKKPWLTVDSRQTGDVAWKGGESNGYDGVDLGGMTQDQAKAAGIGPV